MKKPLILDLSGEWKLADRNEKHQIPAKVPGCVHTDLLRAEVIPDPYFRDNEDRLQWIGETDWTYKRSFEVSGGMLERDRLVLRCEGLDTFSRIRINGNEVARTDNMFRTWEFDIGGYIRPGSNEIEVFFESVIPYASKKREEYDYWSPDFGSLSNSGRSWIRKEQCNFGWDWGPVLVTCGIWRSISILGLAAPRIGDIHLRQTHESDGSVRLFMDLALAEVSELNAISGTVRLSQNSETVAVGDFPVVEGKGIAEWIVENPKLWWPNGMGEQPLYDLEVSLSDDAGIVLDSRSISVGLRTLELVREEDEWGQSFRFRANGRDFFAKGANWIPADAFDGRVSDDDLRDLLECAAEANMNMIRVWGGGLYERDTFYELCDKLGLCVWQDFMFACAAYPASDDAFMKNVRIEAEQNVKRLRSHPCLALWCGNNELEQIPGIIGDKPGQMSWEHYSRLFDELLQDVVHELDPERSYWPSSEHTPVGDRSNTGDLRSGDAHCWAVWHGGQPFEWYHTSFHRFCSEFGFQSFALPATIESYTLPEDRNITSHVMEWHQKCPKGNGSIIRQMINWFRMPEGFENTVWLSHILQALAIKYAVEHWRRNMPRCMGAIYWQLNDCWPVASWSSIDSSHRWKALHYEAKRFFAPYLVSAQEDMSKGTLDIHVTSDSPESTPGVVSIFVDTIKGETVYSDSTGVVLPENGSSRVETHDLSTLLQEHGKRNLLVYLVLEVDGKIVSQNLATFARPKHLNIPPPGLTAEIVTKDPKSAEIRIRAKKPALWVWLDIDGCPDLRCSDNFFHLRAGEEKQIRVISFRDSQLPDNIAELLRVRDLTCTYP